MSRKQDFFTSFFSLKPATLDQIRGDFERAIFFCNLCKSFPPYYATRITRKWWESREKLQRRLTAPKTGEGE